MSENQGSSRLVTCEPVIHHEWQLGPVVAKGHCCQVHSDPYQPAAMGYLGQQDTAALPESFEELAEETPQDGGKSADV